MSRRLDALLCDAVRLQCFPNRRRTLCVAGLEGQGCDKARCLAHAFYTHFSVQRDGPPGFGEAAIRRNRRSVRKRRRAGYRNGRAGRPFHSSSCFNRSEQHVRGSSPSFCPTSTRSRSRSCSVSAWPVTTHSLNAGGTRAKTRNHVAGRGADHDGFAAFCYCLVHVVTSVSSCSASCAS
jgi:hypothetical protein